MTAIGTVTELLNQLIKGVNQMKPYQKSILQTVVALVFLASMLAWTCVAARASLVSQTTILQVIQK